MVLMPYLFSIDNVIFFAVSIFDVVGCYCMQMRELLLPFKSRFATMTNPAAPLLFARLQHGSVRLLCSFTSIVVCSGCRSVNACVWYRIVKLTCVRLSCVGWSSHSQNRDGQTRCR